MEMMQLDNTTNTRLQIIFFIEIFYPQLPTIISLFQIKFSSDINNTVLSYKDYGIIPSLYGDLPQGFGLPFIHSININWCSIGFFGASNKKDANILFDFLFRQFWWKQLMLFQASIAFSPYEPNQDCPMKNPAAQCFTETFNDFSDVSQPNISNIHARGRS